MTEILMFMCDNDKKYFFYA